MCTAGAPENAAGAPEKLGILGANALLGGCEAVVLVGVNVVGRLCEFKQNLRTLK